MAYSWSLNSNFHILWKRTHNFSCLQLVELGNNYSYNVSILVIDRATTIPYLYGSICGIASLAKPTCPIQKSI